MGQLIEAWGDGVCEPRNPGGHAAYGILIKVDGKVVCGRGGYIGFGPKMSNNVAEYSAAISVFDEILNRQLQGIVHLRMDSKLVICQLNGKWKVHGGFYVPYHHNAKHLLSVLKERVQGNVILEWIPREQNGECDTISKDVLRKHGIRFRIQPEGKLNAESLREKKDDVPS